MVNFVKHFFKFYLRCSELIVKYDVSLNILLQQGISEPVFYGDLVYKIKRTVRKPSFPDLFKKTTKHYNRVGYSMGVMSVCIPGYKHNHSNALVSSLIARPWTRAQAQ